MCPVCTVTVIAGLEISRLLGIDDIITSIWIGGLILSVSFWIIEWIGKRGWLKKVKDRKALDTIKIFIIILMYLLALIPLKMNHSIGITGNSLWGADKIILGVAVGSAFFSFGLWADKKERKIKGRQLFKFQKVVFPVFSLIIASVVFYLITKN